MNILVMRFSALGDVAMTLPVVYTLARQYPALHIDFVTSPFFARLFVDPPENLNVIGVNIKKDYKGLGGLFKLWRKLKGLKPDMVADLHNVSRTWVLDSLFRLSGIKTVMADKMRSRRKDAIHKKEPQRQFIDRYCDVFTRLGFPLKKDGWFNRLSGLPESRVSIKRPAIGLAPFARYYNKTYPPNMMREVIRLLDEQGMAVYLFGGKGHEAQTLEQWAEGFDKVESVAGKYEIEEELAMMREMDVMVSMDSANHHLASLVDTPVVSIWGSTTPECGFMAFRQPKSNAMVARRECQPCTIAGSEQCPRGDLGCMTTLLPEKVVEKIISVIKTRDHE